MSEPVAQVKNAADSGQVKRAGRKERTRREREIADMRHALNQEPVRRVLWRLLGYCGVFEDPTHSRGDMTHQNIGRNNVGRFIISEIVDADEDKYLVMQQEARTAIQRERAEAEASQQPRSNEDD